MSDVVGELEDDRGSVGDVGCPLHAVALVSAEGANVFMARGVQDLEVERRCRQGFTVSYRMLDTSKGVIARTPALKPFELRRVALHEMFPVQVHSSEKGDTMRASNKTDGVFMMRLAAKQVSSVPFLTVVFPEYATEPLVSVTLS